ncbi:hypothetical protein IOC61_15975, partial [Halomonas sp. KAO]|uniref:hypothetical protein n=1 Tax=Halomonas sp. KAO TaxID=2783858 RepID=UPI0018A10AD3
GAKGDGVALDASAINTMLQENSVCRGTPGAVYLIDDPIVIPSNTYFDFSRSTLRLANGANCYMLVNEDPTNGDENIILVRGKLDGNSAGQTRNYTSSYLTGYFGFGAAFTKVDNLIIQDWDVADTEAWGISYWHCGSVMFDNFRFDQAETSGQNGDGITGSARCVLVSNISGYTNDD